MKKWIIVLSILVLALCGLLIKVYVSAVDPVKTAEKKAVLLAKKEISLKEVEDFHIYNGIETVNVIEGKSKQGEEIIVWIPEKSKEIFVRKAKNGLTKEAAIQKLQQEKSPKKIISVRLGMEKNIPLWEIYYRSNNNLINYYYVHFDTGEWLKKIENL
ncbi:cell wall elongation regulator TseB-like domain-containing protein [Bacillaceae bacterium C204]|uniref:cell wall elongation regulator TseB-like domain-containing protein n=1 Tax=Neobacillus sp. 204 TaxID=3383351 RepID=UPI00397DC7AE